MHECFGRALFVALVIVVSGPMLRAQTSAGARPPSPSSEDAVARLERELADLRREYADRLAALETQIQELRAAAQAPVAPSPPVEPPPPPPPPTGAAATSSKVFNPDIAAIGDFIGAMGRPGGPEPSLEMHESELSFQAVVDPYARADFFLTFGPDTVGVEEAFITFPTLPGGLLMKVGKMRDAFGKVNGQHNHVLPFVDRPLVTQNLLGGEDGLADAGISVARLVPNPWMFLEATAQVYRGESTVFKAPARSDLAYLGHLRAYRDVSESSNIDVGGSFAYGHNGAEPDSTTRLFGVDATFRYRPLRRSIYTHVLLRGEAAWSQRSELPGTPTAFGAYAYLEYQFARRWFAGVRLDTADHSTDPSQKDKGGSFILTFWPSEFSQIRTQYRYTRYAEQPGANELLFQFLFAIGAHGAHAF